MSTIFSLIPASLLILAVCCSAGAEEKFLPGFPDNKLTDWVNANGAPDTWRMDEAGVLHCTGAPTAALRTVRQYENFILEVDWRHMKPGGNAGIFVWGSAIAAKGVPFLRAIEVQVLDNGYDVKGRNEWYTTHGDIFPIHGSSMEPIGRHNGMRAFPSAEHSKSSPEWNHYRIEANDGGLKLYVNSILTTQGKKCDWRKGYLGLESEGSPTEWKNLRIAELPSTGATPAMTAPLDQGWRTLYTGVNFDGWKAPAGWEVSDWQITGSGAGPLVTAGDIAGGSLSIDVSVPAGSKDTAVATWCGVDLVKASALKPGAWHRLLVTSADGAVHVSVDGAAPADAGKPTAAASPLALMPGFQFGNIYHRAPSAP